VTTPALSNVDVAMLRLAGEWWHNAAAKEQAITERFGLSPIRFWQRVAHLIDTPAALAAEPQIVHRLQRIRAARRARLGRRLPRSTR
jgi:hypothetical protein